MNRVADARLVISERIVRRDRLHGTWWPRTTDLEVELPLMLARARSRVNVVLGMSLNRDDWPGVPIIVQASQLRSPKISWYGLTEPHLALLHAGGSTRIALLLLHPDTPEEVAVRAMLMTTTPGNSLGTTQTLARARELVTQN